MMILGDASVGPNIAMDLSRKRLAACLDDARGALSDNTVRAIGADLEGFISWCGERGASPLPARASTVAAYVDAMADTRAPATVRRYLFSIRTVHRATGEPDPGGHPRVHRALQRLRRRNRSRQKQAQGLTRELVQSLLDAGGDRVIDFRNRALLAVAYDAMLRRFELVALQVVDMKPDTEGSASLYIRRGKTDPGGTGVALYLRRDTVTMVRRWLDAGGVSSGSMFRSVRTNGVVAGALDESQVPRIFKAMAERAGLPADTVKRISGHSPRVGAAQDMIAAGIGIAAIMQAGRWKSPSMVQRYGARLLPQRNGAAQLARLQERDVPP